MHPLKIEVENTPNPETLKFLINRQIVANDIAISFNNIDDALNSPLAQHMLHIDGVKSVFLASNFISITKKEDFDWTGLDVKIHIAIMDHISAGYPIIIESRNDKSIGIPHELQTEIEKQINAVINEKIRPAVQGDGGDVIMHAFKDGIVYLEMQGACSGCPQSIFTLKAGIEKTLKHFIPEVISVEQV